MKKFDFSFLSTLFSQLPNIIVIGLILVAGIFIYKEFKIFTEKFGLDINSLKDARFDEQQRKIDEINRQYLQLAENIARAQTNVISEEELERIFERTVDSKIQEIVKKNKEQISSLGKAIASLSPNIDMDVTPDGEFIFTNKKGKKAVIYNTYVYADSQDNERGLQLAQVVFDQSDSTFTKSSDPLKFEATIVRTEQLTGTFNHYFEIDAYNPFDKIYRQKPYKLKVDTFYVSEKRIKDNHWFFPQMHIEGGFGYGSDFKFAEPKVGFDLGLSLIAYGRTEDDNYLRFLRLGLGITENIESSFANVSPIGLNVKTFLPFLKDTYIFPGVSFRKDSPMGFSTSISTTF